MSATIRITPERPLIDDDIHIRISGIGGLRRVTVVARVSENKERFIAWGHYVSNKDGNVDFTTDDSLGGSYTGMHVDQNYRPAVYQ